MSGSGSSFPDPFAAAPNSSGRGKARGSERFVATPRNLRWARAKPGLVMAGAFFSLIILYTGTQIGAHTIVNDQRRKEV